MSWTSLATWAALVMTGLLTGGIGSRWRSGDRALSARMEAILLVAAASGVIAWFANAGALLGNSAGNPLLAAYVPAGASALTRLAALWSTRPGGALTLAAMLLVGASLISLGRDNRIRFVATLSLVSLAALGTAIWFSPATDATARVIRPFAQAVPAALAPLCALASVAGVALTGALAVARATLPRGVVLVSWLAATLSLVLEQMARTRLGVGPREGIVLGSASAGVMLWLVTSALLHRRVQARIGFHTRPRSPSPAAAVVAHAGAGLLAISFAVHAFAERATVTIAAGTPVDVRDAFDRPWMLANQGVSRFDSDGVEVTTLAIAARDPEGREHLIVPEIREHHGQDGRHLENPVSLRRSTGGALQSMRVLLQSADSLDVASVRVTFIPVPILWPAGVALLFLSMTPLLARPPRSKLPDE